MYGPNKQNKANYCQNQSTVFKNMMINKIDGQKQKTWAKQRNGLN